MCLILSLANYLKWSFQNLTDEFIFIFKFIYCFEFIFTKLIVIFTFKSISSFWKKLTSRPDKFKTSFIGVWW